MFESNSHKIDQDLNVLVKDVQALFQEAASLSGDKADALRQQAMQLLDSAVDTQKTASERLYCSGKKIAGTAYDCAKTHPWSTVAAVAGFGLLLGVILGRK
ncbi:DUF883 family protein [Deefgea rivuli]|uniref:DUF883 family protein n=1 Tax=Deefgea rivuli TaxID=400948 RepID=UPI00048099EA|nr:DUF883 family protein [Deefgea rivuli]